MSDITRDDVKEATAFTTKWIIISVATVFLGTIICSFLGGFAAFITGTLAVLGLLSTVAGVIVMGIIKTGHVIDDSNV